jgi:hypothetical protein
MVLTACDPNTATSHRQEEVASQLDDAMIAITEQIRNALQGFLDTLRQA